MAAGRSPCIVRARTVSTNGVREGPCPMIAGTGGGATAERGAMVFLKFIRHCHGEAGGSPRPCSGGRPIARSPCRSGRSRTANEFRFLYFSCRKVACPALAADTSGLLRRRGRGASDAVRIKPFVRRTVAGPLVRRRILANDCVRVCRHVRRQTDGGPQAVGRWRRKGKVRSFVPQTLPVSDRVRPPPSPSGTFFPRYGCAGRQRAHYDPAHRPGSCRRQSLLPPAENGGATGAVWIFSTHPHRRSTLFPIRAGF